jgi:hypothetical protein
VPGVSCRRADPSTPALPGCVTALPACLQLGEVVGGRPFICVKSSKDTRYSDHWIMTHGGGCVRCLPFHSLAEFKAHMSFRWHKIQVGAVMGAVTWVGREQEGEVGGSGRQPGPPRHLWEAAWGL